MRAWKQNSSGTTYYFYDGDTLIMETDATGAKTAVNTNGPSGLLARTTATRTLLFAFDALGQLSQQVIAGAGTIAATYLFDAWGTRAFSSADTAATSDPYSGYGSSSGYISDWETGLQLLGHRYYDPGTGRFLNRDPIGMAGGVNVYAYCRNSPIFLRDTTGALPWQPLPPNGNWGGPDSDGPVGAIGGGCLGGAIGGIIQLLGPGAGSEALCSILAGCAAGALGAIIAAGIVALFPPAAAFYSCLAGAIGSLLSSLASAICSPCHKLPPLSCMLLGAAVGCATSFLGGFGGLLLGNILGSASDSFCTSWGGANWKKE